MMARCVGNERQCRSVFYGSMISESVIALIWAAIAMAFFGGADLLGTALEGHRNNPAWAVDVISHTTLGRIGSVLAILGVVAAPITSGDTAFRSARLIISDMFGYDQKPLLNRLLVCIPLFVIGYGLTLIDFGIIWRYFAWSNQALAMVTLWAIYVWLVRRRANYWVALIPAVAMTYIIFTYVFISNQFLGLASHTLCYSLGGLVTAAVTALMVINYHKSDSTAPEKRR